MEEYQTDEQQIAALKNWWQQYGRSLLTGVVLALALVFGWRAWQSHQSTESETAALQYQSIVAAFETARDAEEASDAKASASVTLKTLVEKLQSEYPGSVYSHLAGFYLAKHGMSQADYDVAVEQLSWVKDTAKDEAIVATATQRLARVLWAKEDVAGAQAVLEDVSVPAYQAVIAELKGDLYLASGEPLKARVAYQEAKNSEFSVRPFVELKLNDLSE